MWETWVQSLGQEDPLEKEMATHSIILAWRIPWTEEPGGLQSMGLKESDTTEQLHFHFLLYNNYSQVYRQEKDSHTQYYIYTYITMHVYKWKDMYIILIIFKMGINDYSNIIHNGPKQILTVDSVTHIYMCVCVCVCVCVQTYICKIFTSEYP